MEHFARLVGALRRLTQPHQKVEQLRSALEELEPIEAAWTLKLLSEPPPARVSPQFLHKLAIESSGLSEWLASECRAMASAAEVCARILPDPPSAGRLTRLAETMEGYAARADKSCPQALTEAWSRMTGEERIIFNQWVSGRFLSPVSRQEALLAASLALNVPEDALAEAALPVIEPSANWWRGASNSTAPVRRVAAPKPAAWSPDAPAPEGWVVGWAHQGLSAVMAFTSGQAELISEGRQNLAAAFPEVVQAFPEGFCAAGRIVAGRGLSDAEARALRPSAALARRAPAVFIVEDVLAADGKCLDGFAWQERILAFPFAQSEAVQLVEHWPAGGDLAADLRRARSLGHAGLWLRNPESADGAQHLLQPPPLRFAAVFTTWDGEGEATFAVWQGEALIPIARAALSLSAEDRAFIRQFIRENTVESFGPVRVVRPELVFEITVASFEPSSRRKAKLAAQGAQADRLLREANPSSAAKIEEIWEEVGLHKARKGSHVKAS